MRFQGWLLLGLLLPAVASAQEPDLTGRYQGTTYNRRADGSRGAQSNLFVIIRRDGQDLACTAGTSSFESQIPCEAVSAEASHFRFSLPFGGGVLFDLAAADGVLTGSLASKPGAPPAPFNTVELRRSAGLTLSDQSPPLAWEGNDRSTAILELRKQIAETGASAVAAFWQARKAAGGPIIEPLSDRSALVTFLWQGNDEKNVFLLWPRLSTARPDSYFFSRIPGTDIWFKTQKVRAGTRIYYQISPDDPLGQRPSGTGARKAQADPLNPKRDTTDPAVPLTRARSLLELPGAPAQPFYVKNPAAPKYTMVEETLQSRHLKGERKVKVYLPPGHSAKHAPYPTLYYTDGEDPDGLVFATWTFENLLAAKKIPPTIIVRIVNPDQASRGRELSCDAGFADYLKDDLLALIRKKFNASADPARTAIGGYSLGGLAAACAAFRYPQSFGLVLSQSGSYWFEPTAKDFAEPNWLASQFAGSRKLPIRFYMEAGTNELDMAGDGSGILVPNRQLRDVLRAKGYPVTYQEFDGDHEYLNWRGTLADGVMALFGKR